MKGSSIATFLVSHLVAAAISFIIFVAVPVVFAIACTIIENDPGGPMFFPIFILMCLFFSVCACVGLFVISGLLQLIRLKLPFPWWVPIVLVFPLSFAVLLLIGDDASLMPFMSTTSFSLLIGFAFATYWLSLSASASIMNWLRTKMRRVTEP